MQSYLPVLKAITVDLLSPAVALTGINASGFALYYRARLFINCPNDKWEISSEVRKVFIDPCSISRILLGEQA